MINLSLLSAAKLKNGSYDDELPEFITLRKMAENGSWHNHQIVFDHIVRVMEEIEKLIAQDKFSKVLKQKVSKHSRKELLLLAAMLHDIAKKDLLLSDDNGMTSAPGHEMVGASWTKHFADRFGLDNKETSYVESIVLYHGFTSELLNLILIDNNLPKYVNIFKEVVGEVELELYLFICADVRGSDLETLDNNGFNRRIEIIDRLLNLYD